jgi:putative ABC transport system permease protein
MYFSSHQVSRAFTNIVLRVQGDPLNYVAALRQEVQALDKTLALSRVQTMEEIVSATVAVPRLVMLLFASFAAVALVLASLGIYGVMAYSVTQRTHEIGIRIALGAQTRNVLGLVVGQGMKLAVLGVGLGLAASFGLTRLMESLLFGIQATDPLTFAAVALLLTLVALLACYLPARRATKVDPMIALRYE